MTSVLSLQQQVSYRVMSLEAFLDYDDGTETLYELENGKLRPMPSESDINRRMAMFLLVYFSQLKIPFYRLAMNIEIAVSGARSTVRVPDFTILTEELAQGMKGQKRSIALPEMPPPQLVVEVVSPGKENENRDYRYKRVRCAHATRTQYQAREIAEYWIVDPVQKK